MFIQVFTGGLTETSPRWQTPEDESHIWKKTSPRLHKNWNNFPPCKLRNILIRSNRIRRAVLACPKNGKVCSGFSLAWKPLEKSARIEMRRLRWEKIWKISCLDGGDLFFSYWTQHNNIPTLNVCNIQWKDENNDLRAKELRSFEWSFQPIFQTWL